MHTTSTPLISTVNALENIQHTQQLKQTKKTGFVQWTKCRLVKVWPKVKKTLVSGAIISAIVAPIIGAGLGIATLYAAGYYGVLYAIALLATILATPPILMIYLYSQGVGG